MCFDSSRLPTLVRTAAFRLLAVAVLVTASPAAFAQDAAKPPKIAVIDVERILTESNAGKKTVAELQALQKQKEGELSAKQNEVKQLQQKLSDGQLSLAADKLAEIQKELEDKGIALRRLADDAQRELTKKRDELLAKIETAVFPIINQVGKEGGYTLIFNKFQSGLVYADEGSDLTNLVIERFNASQAGG